MQHFWHIMLYYFMKGKNTTEMQEKIRALYGEGAMADQTCQKWFVKFCAGDFSLDDAPWLGKPVEVDRDQIEYVPSGIAYRSTSLPPTGGWGLSTLS